MAARPAGQSIKSDGQIMLNQIEVDEREEVYRRAKEILRRKKFELDLQAKIVSKAETLLERRQNELDELSEMNVNEIIEYVQNHGSLLLDTTHTYTDGAALRDAPDCPLGFACRCE